MGWILWHSFPCFTVLQYVVFISCVRMLFMVIIVLPTLPGLYLCVYLGEKKNKYRVM